jgi:hypothetical protein
MKTLSLFVPSFFYLSPGGDLTEGVNIPSRVHRSPLGAKFTPRGKLMFLKTGHSPCRNFFNPPFYVWIVIAIDLTRNDWANYCVLSWTIKQVKIRCIVSGKKLPNSWCSINTRVEWFSSFLTRKNISYALRGALSGIWTGCLCPNCTSSV